MLFDYEQREQEKRNARMRLADETICQSFLNGNISQTCPRCGAVGEWLETQGGLDEGWEEHTFKCPVCEIEWVERFECQPEPFDIYITEIPEERVSETPYMSHRIYLDPEELNAIVDKLLEK